ncbi:hypothetical protein J6590_025767 [Homalodisca vitripennis]|nr:hypothetical protein J6590_025767 [Homalodisca vitripennis]
MYMFTTVLIQFFKRSESRLLLEGLCMASGQDNSNLPKRLGVKILKHEALRKESVEPQELIKQTDSKFLCLLYMEKRILVSNDKTYKSIQKEAVTVDMASKMIKRLLNTIQEIREEGMGPAIDYGKSKRTNRYR